MSQASALNYIEEHYDRFQNELIELLRIPSISHDPNFKPDMDKAANWLADKLREGSLNGKVETLRSQQMLPQSDMVFLRYVLM